MKKIFLLFTSLILAISSLSCAPGLYEYHSVSPARYHEHYREIPMYVDGHMTKEGRQSLANAINDWNYALNKEMLITVKTWALDVNTDSGQAIVQQVKITHQGIVVLWLNHDDPVVQAMDPDGNALAFVDGLGRKADMLVIVQDTIGNRNLKVILEHEIGHILGASHTMAKSLMYPYADSNQSPCIDKITMLQIANYNDLDPAVLNYCVIPNLN